MYRTYKAHSSGSSVWEQEDPLHKIDSDTYVLLAAETQDVQGKMHKAICKSMSLYASTKI